MKLLRHSCGLGVLRGVVGVGLVLVLLGLGLGAHSVGFHHFVHGEVDDCVLVCEVGVGGSKEGGSDGDGGDGSEGEGGDGDPMAPFCRAGFLFEVRVGEFVFGELVSVDLGVLFFCGFWGRVVGLSGPARAPPVGV